MTSKAAQNMRYMRQAVATEARTKEAEKIAKAVAKGDRTAPGPVEHKEECAIAARAALQKWALAAAEKYAG